MPLLLRATDNTAPLKSADVYSTPSSARSVKCEHACRITLLAGDPGEAMHAARKNLLVAGRSSNYSRMVAVLMNEISGKLALRYALPLFCKRSCAKRKSNRTSKHIYFHTNESLPHTPGSLPAVAFPRYCKSCPLHPCLRRRQHTARLHAVHGTAHRYLQ